MALYKSIEMDNGIILNYHRIVSLTMFVNRYNVIEIQSYISNDKREEEKDNPSFANIYIETKYFTVDYSPNMSIDDAYEFLKKLDIFEGAEDC